MGSQMLVRRSSDVGATGQRRVRAVYSRLATEGAEVLDSRTSRGLA